MIPTYRDSIKKKCRTDGVARDAAPAQPAAARTHQPERPARVAGHRLCVLRRDRRRAQPVGLGGRAPAPL